MRSFLNSTSLGPLCFLGEPIDSHVGSVKGKRNLEGLGVLFLQTKPQESVFMYSVLGHVRQCLPFRRVQVDLGQGPHRFVLSNLEGPWAGCAWLCDRRQSHVWKSWDTLFLHVPSFFEPDLDPSKQITCCRLKWKMKETQQGQTSLTGKIQVSPLQGSSRKIQSPNHKIQIS